MQFMQLNLTQFFKQKVIQKFQSKLLILTYHRVAELKSDPQLLSVKPGNFSEQIRIIKDLYHPLSLPELSMCLKEGKIPKNAIVITFDDGYADNLWNAKPILDKYNVPATVFITADRLGSDSEFWWDELERLLLIPEILPDKIAFDIGKQKYTWDLTNQTFVNTTNNKDTSKLNSLKSFLNPPPKNAKKIAFNPRYKMYMDLHTLLRPLSAVTQTEILNSLRNATGSTGRGRSDYRQLTSDEVKKLIDSELIGVGAHTCTHSMLSNQPRHEQVKEINNSKKILEKITGIKIISFSYPFGDRRSFDENIKEIVRKAGFKVACTTIAHPVTRTSDRYALPRFIVRDWNKEEFIQKLETWLYG